MPPKTLRTAALCVLALAPLAQAQKTHTLPATPQTVVWGHFDASLPPALTVHSGDTVIMQTLSTCGTPASLEARGVAPADIPPYVQTIWDNIPADKGPGSHILTGPVTIAEAEPGDVLEVRIKKIHLDVPWACNSQLKGGFLDADFPGPHAKIIPLDRTRMTGNFAPGVTVPLRPFFGDMGLAPAPESGRISSGPPGANAGNMDLKELTAGTSVFIPVRAKGALFQTGDGHAGQGNGEIDIMALETQLTGTFQFIVHKKKEAEPPLEWPRAETPTHYISTGFDRDLTQAATISIHNMITFLSAQMTDHPRLSPEDAYALISVACDVDVTELVDGNKGIHTMCPKSLFTTPKKTPKK